MENIPSCLKHWADTQPEKEAFVFFNEKGRTTVLTPKDVYNLAGRFAAQLRVMGFQKGEMIDNAMKNCPERIVADMGVMMAGCVVCNLQALEKDGSDLWKTLQCNKSTGIILPVHDSNHVYEVLQPYLQPACTSIDVSLANAPSVRKILLITRGIEDGGSCKSFIQNLREDSSEIFVHPEILPEDLAFIYPTSGTSGMSKQVPRTHDNIMRIAQDLGKSPPSKRYCQNQIGWLGGFPFTFLANCSCTLIQDCFTGKAKINVKEIWDLIEQEGCTVGFSFPPELERFIDYFKHNDPHRFRLPVIITGGQPLSKRLISETLQYLSEGVVISYASTEMGIITNSYVRSQDQMQDFQAGLPAPGVQVKVVDSNMEAVEPGQSGDVLVKSPFGVYHYYNQPVPKPTCTDDGYFITGDRGWLTQDGVLYITDRSDNVIINGIVSVFPSWPESVLTKIPGVAEAVVVGIPVKDDVVSKVCACIVFHKGSELPAASLISAYDERFMSGAADAFLPKLDHVEVFQSFPRTETGKVKRKQLRQLVIDRLVQSLAK